MGLEKTRLKGFHLLPKGHFRVLDYLKYFWSLITWTNNFCFGHIALFYFLENFLYGRLKDLFLIKKKLSFLNEVWLSTFNVKFIEYIFLHRRWNLH